MTNAGADEALAVAAVDIAGVGGDRDQADLTWQLVVSPATVGAILGFLG